MSRRWLVVAAGAGVAACAALFIPAVAEECDPLTDIHCHQHHHRRAKPAAGRSGPLLPVREYLTAADIPPAGAGAYGMVAFKSKTTSASRAKLLMICQSFVAHFPTNASIPPSWPLSDRMITVWPLDDPDSEKALADDCDYVVDHYDLFAGESAIADAELQQADLKGDGPFLIGWSPSNTRGLPDDLVLVIDMSADNTQKLIDREFTFWKDKIVEDPSLWRSGFTEQVRVVIHDFADHYGSDVLDAIKLVGMKP